MAVLFQSAFTQFRYQLKSHDLIESEAVFIYDTKIEVNANKYRLGLEKISIGMNRHCWKNLREYEPRIF